MPTIPPGSPEQEQSTVHNSLLRTKISLLDSPTRASPPRLISPFLAEVVRPLILERDQCRIDDTLDTAIKLLDRDIQQHINQEAQDQWRSLLESSDRATNPKR